MTMDPNRTQIPRTRPKPGDCTSPGGGGGLRPSIREQASALASLKNVILLGVDHQARARARKKTKERSFRTLLALDSFNRDPL